MFNFTYFVHLSIHYPKRTSRMMRYATLVKSFLIRCFKHLGCFWQEAAAAQDVYISQPHSLWLSWPQRKHFLTAYYWIVSLKLARIMDRCKWRVLWQSAKVLKVVTGPLCAEDHGLKPTEPALSQRPHILQHLRTKGQTVPWGIYSVNKHTVMKLDSVFIYNLSSWWECFVCYE